MTVRQFIECCSFEVASPGVAVCSWKESRLVFDQEEDSYATLNETFREYSTVCHIQIDNIDINVTNVFIELYIVFFCRPLVSRVERCLL